MSRRRKNRGTVESLLNLDSLVDVVTNTNGMLLLLAVFTVLLALGTTYRVGFPVAQASEKQPVFFECHNNRVVLIGMDSNYSDHYYLTPLGRHTMVHVKEPQRGETPAEIRKPHAAFWETIDAMDPAMQYAAFIVRPDGFEVFRAVRSLLGQHSIDVGWEPQETGIAIVFGPGGKGIEVQ